MLRSRFLIALALTIVLSTGYFYTAYQAVCALPLSYAVAEPDPRFNLSAAAAETAVTEAVAVWEAGMAEAVFVRASSTATADVLVRFVFDERQELTAAEVRERERLAVVEALSGEVQATYQAKLAELERREAAYESDADAYERDLAQHNAQVARYNDAGGAPPAVYDELDAEGRRLNQAAERLNQEAVALNDLIDEINQLGTEGNAIVDRFNERIDDFNTTFADGREFTQGDYQAGVITIYSFANRDELHTVLVHELGHALQLEHVDDPQAYMHYLLGQQIAWQPLQPADVAALEAQCTPAARLDTVPQPWRSLFAWVSI